MTADEKREYHRRYRKIVGMGNGLAIPPARQRTRNGAERKCGGLVVHGYQANACANVDMGLTESFASSTLIERLSRERN